VTDSSLSSLITHYNYTYTFNNNLYHSHSHNRTATANQAPLWTVEIALGYPHGIRPPVEFVGRIDLHFDYYCLLSPSSSPSSPVESATVATSATPSQTAATNTTTRTSNTSSAQMRTRSSSVSHWDLSSPLWWVMVTLMLLLLLLLLLLLCCCYYGHSLDCWFHPPYSSSPLAAKDEDENVLLANELVPLRTRDVSMPRVDYESLL
jgi:hypothetical protein